MPVLRKPLDLGRVTPLDYAYAAGILDGEGCLAIVRSQYKNYPVNYEARIEVGMVDDCVCPWLFATFGGDLRRKTVVWKGVPRLTYRWSVGTERLDTFLRAIRPYLKLKGEIADLLLAHRATVGAPAKNITEETREFRRQLYEQVKALRLKRRVAA